MPATAPPVESRLAAIEAALGLRAAREAAARERDRQAAETALAAARAARAANLAEARKLVVKLADAVAPLAALVARLDELAADDRAERARERDAAALVDPGAYVSGSLPGCPIDAPALARTVEAMRDAIERIDR